MSDLWMILVLLGVSIVLAVVVFNWWQEKKYRRDVEYRFSHTRSDLLDSEPSAKGKEAGKKAAIDATPASEEVEGWMSEPRVRQTGMRPAAQSSAKIEPEFSNSESIKAAEPAPLKPKSAPVSTPVKPVSVQQSQAPVLNVAPTTTPAAPVVAPAYQRPATEPVPAEVVEQPALAFATSPVEHPQVELAEAVPASQSPSLELPAAVHPSMDWVGLIDAPLGVMLVELEDMQAEVRTFPQHATLWAQNSATFEWQDVLALDAAAMQTQTPASQVACSLQLADRGGPVDIETLKRFQKSMETLARALGLTVIWQGGYEPASQAQAIDAFCIEVDKAVEFHVLANQGMFHATKLRGLAEACGMQLSAEGRFELFNADGQLVFSVRNYEGKPFSADMLKSAVMTGVTFQLDIPTTPDSLQVFDQMVEIARHLATSLNASLIDVNRKAIGDPQLDKIRQQLKNISNSMASQGIIPGSRHAQRLFS